MHNLSLAKFHITFVISRVFADAVWYNGDSVRGNQPGKSELPVQYPPPEFVGVKMEVEEERFPSRIDDVSDTLAVKIEEAALTQLSGLSNITPQTTYSPYHLSIFSWYTMGSIAM